MLFVTHDLGEALTLADRIILLSARPGRLKEDFEVPLPAAARCRGAARNPRVRRGCSPDIWHSLGEEFRQTKAE